MDIDLITGNIYAVQAKESLKTFKALRCPYPKLEQLASINGSDASNVRLSSDPDCIYVFTRAYDLRRHLRAIHDIDIDKERVDEWVKERKAIVEHQ